MAKHPGFVSLGDAEFVEGVKNGTIVAGINGVWRCGEEKWDCASKAAIAGEFCTSAEEAAPVLDGPCPLSRKRSSWFSLLSWTKCLQIMNRM